MAEGWDDPLWYNQHGRPWGKGSTTPGRKDTRKQKQWEYLEKPLEDVLEDPGSKECLEKHLAALEKATEACRKRLELVRAAEEEAAEALLQAKKKKRESSRRKVLEKTSSSGEPASSSASSCSMLSLGKGSKKKSRSKSRPAAEPPALDTPTTPEKADLTSLEKQRSSSARRGKMGTREVDLVPGPGAFLPPTREEPLEKEPFLKKEEPLEKGTGEQEMGLEKPKVLVDWFGTLANKNGVPKDNARALERLLEKADVYLLSWVGSKKRKDSTLQEMEALEKAMLDKLRFHGTTYQKLGQNGKVDHAVWWGCDFLIEDDDEVCAEAMAYNLEAYQVKRGNWSLEKGQFSNFPEAVDAVLEKL